MGRAAQGVRLINLKGNAEIAAIARVPRSDEEEAEFDEEGNPIEPTGETENGTDIENPDVEN
jgi:DNA gyrase subunit A